MEKPGEDATSAEIAAWLESDFWSSFAEGIGTSGEEDDEE